MKVVVAIDSLKGSLSSLEAGKVIQEGIYSVLPDAEVFVRPLADGGEGTMEALTFGLGGKFVQVEVKGPLGEAVNCPYGIVEEKKLAIVDISGAAGITLVPEQARNPMNTTTYGVGEVIRDAIEKGCRHFIVGIGGSATNDGGIGMLQALGFGMLNKEGKQVSLGAKGLNDLVTITDNKVLPELKECSFRVACDVKNVLCGEQGCSAIFGPQKGATKDMILQMDQWLAKYAVLTEKKFGTINAKKEGTGAAGGLGFAFLAYMNSVLESGVQIVLEETRLEDYIAEADFVITGEGRLDEQTIFGKAPIGVAALAKKYQKKVLAFCGCVTEDAILCNKEGIDAFFPILRGIQTKKEAMNCENTKKNMFAAVQQVFRLIACINEK